MKAYEYNGRDMARMLRCSPATISGKLTGRTPWLSWEMHAIMKKLEIQPQEMYEYFPPDGEDVQPLAETRISEYLADRDEVIVSRQVLDIMAAAMKQLTGEAI